MSFLSLNFNRYKITKIAFSAFLIISIFNWALMPNNITYAEDEILPAQETIVVATTSEAQETPLPENATINTGEAISSSDVVNEVNTNEVNSEGVVVVVGDSLGDSSLDLRDSFGTTTASSTCESCVSTTTINIENQNLATTSNDILVFANTGENSASSTATSSIQTGDALAGANVVNVVNSNIVDSKYMLLVFNNFGNWSGDLVLPNGDFFKNFLSLFNPNCNCGGNTNISNSNEASVLNQVSTSAESGDNNVASGGNINTGNALASTNTYNLVNANVYNNSSFYLLVKVFGDWNGNIFNLPSGIAWQNTPEGIVLYNQNENPFSENSNLANGGESNLNLQNNNTANVLNNINVNANSGNNNATGTDVMIRTGNAYAGANVVNVVNTNIVSSNWLTALVNIFGNWQGSISFGQPDLWIGTVASVDGEALAGSSVTFTTTVKNNGDARASNINILAHLQSSNFKFMQTNSDSHLDHIEALNPGESAEFSYTGMIERFVPDQRPPVIINSSVSALETDANMQDNLDHLSFVIANNPGGALMTQNSFSSSYPHLSVTKTHTVSSSVVIDGLEMVPFGGSTDYKIIVKNEGGSAYEGVLYDQLKNDKGEIINEQSWDLGEILPNEEIIITYTTLFGASTTPGTYTNYAWVESLDNADSNIATDTLIVASKPTVPVVTIETPTESPIVGEVLGLLTEKVSNEVQEEQFVEILGGFCSEEKQNSAQKLSLAQSVLLGLSFILIIQKKKHIPHNLFLF